MEESVKEVAAKEGEAVSPSSEIFNIPINFRYSNNAPLQYANHSTVHVGEHEIVISFFQSTVSIERAADGEEYLNRLRENGVDAECVARIVVSKSFYQALTELLKRNLPQFDKEQLKELLTQLTTETEGQ